MIYINFAINAKKIVLHAISDLIANIISLICRECNNGENQPNIFTIS